MEYEELISDTLSSSNDKKELYVPISSNKNYITATNDDLARAKELLSSVSTKSNLSLYDHLTAVLKKIIREKVENAVDIFEDISLKVKSIRYIESSVLVEVLPPDERLLNFIEHYKTLIQTLPEDESEIKAKVDIKSSSSSEESEKVDDEEEDEEKEEAFSITKALPDIQFHMSRFGLAGIGLSADELFYLTLAMKVLVREYKLERVRFWGKLFALQCNYYVVEALYKDNIKPEDFGYEDKTPITEIEQVAEGAENTTESEDDEDKDDEEEDEKEDDDEDKEDDDEDKDEDDEKEMKEENIIQPEPVPKPRAKSVPPEENGTGVNEYVYFVCSKIGEPWRCLPSLKPYHLVVAKQIKRFFSGNLDADVLSSFTFSGKEAHYLRAQIARITASTSICLKNFYTTTQNKSESDEESSESEESENGNEMYKNDDFEPPSVASAFAEGVNAWVHCRKAILDQGRCTWMKMAEEKEAKEGEDADEEASGSDEDSEKSEEEEKEDEKEESDIEAPKETAVPLLRSLSEDKALGKFHPWSVKLSSKLMTETAILVVRSNLWPGAYTYFDGKVCETIYIGDGHKFSIYHYAPPIHSVWQKEYVAGPELAERIDYPIPEPEPEVEDEEKEDEDEDEESGSGSSSSSSGSS